MRACVHGCVFVHAQAKIFKQRSLQPSEKTLPRLQAQTLSSATKAILHSIEQTVLLPEQALACEQNTSTHSAQPADRLPMQDAVLDWYPLQEFQA